MVNDLPPPAEPPRYEGHRPRSATERAEVARPRRHKRRVTTGLAVMIAAAAFSLGAALGWVGRGGPADPALVTTNQDVPAVTVTQDVTAGG